MKLTYQAAQNLHAQLAALSQPVPVVLKGELAHVVPALKGTTRTIVARMKAALKPHVDAAVEATNGVVAQHGGQVKPTNPNFAAVVKELDAIGKTAVDVPELDTLTLPLAEFEAEGSNILPDITEALLPYLK